MMGRETKHIVGSFREPLAAQWQSCNATKRLPSMRRWRFDARFRARARFL